MKTKIFACIVAGIVAMQTQATCTVDLAVMQVPHDAEIPHESLDYLSHRLQSVCGMFSFDTDKTASRFFIAGKFNNSYTSTLPGPPEQTAVRTALTLYIGDIETKKVFSTLSIELRGAGTSPQRAYINALGPVSADNHRIQSFLDNAREGIIAYYDESFPTIKLQVVEAVQQHNYKKALWLLSLVPSCSSAYSEAMELALPLIKKDINRQGELLLLAARTYWASSPDKGGAEKALECILQIDPSASSFPAAQTLIEEIKAHNISDLDFEAHHKYETEAEIRKLALDVTRAIGIAYGQGPKPPTNILEWINHL